MIPPIPETPSHVSVNRVQIEDLPGLPIDDEVRGRRAYDLLSSHAIIRYARERADALELPAAFAEDSLQTRLELPPFVEACLSSSRDQTRAAARAIGRRLGRNLGHVLLTLHRGDAVNRAVRPDWTEQDWARWGQVERVWLGGGLVSGRLGELIVAHARAFLAEAGYAERPQVARAAHPGELTLLGAGRYLPAATRHALCLDFGHTRVKRAGLSFTDGVLTGLRPYAPLATELEWLGTPYVPNPETGRRLLGFVRDAVVQTWDECATGGITPGAEVMLVVAAYVRGGRLLGNGLYANLNTLAEAIGARVGQPVNAHLIHDGTAACAVRAGEPRSAVLLVGTALGIGFPPADAHGLRPLSAELVLD